MPDINLQAIYTTLMKFQVFLENEGYFGKLCVRFRYIGKYRAMCNYDTSCNQQKINSVTVLTCANFNSV